MSYDISLLDWKFVLLLSAVGLSRCICPRRYYAQWGALSSLLLITIGAPSTALIICGITLLYLYPAHRLMHWVGGRENGDALLRWILPASVFGLVFLLVAFKVYRHFSLPFFGGTLISNEVAKLIGFSYFIFRAVGFLHIQSILKFKESKPWGLLFFALFPPTLTSGPIHKFQDFRQQLDAPQPLSKELLLQACYRITRGFFRKLVLAYLLNEIVKKLLDLPEANLLFSVLTISCLFMFFYFDFAGYSDVAIGFGLLMGIRVPENFRNPFQATTASEFWRHWHITLADWFRDQVFIPMGAMGRSRLYAACVAFFIMLLCGLWHGLTLSFVAWGVWHGTILFIEALSGAKPLAPANKKGFRFIMRALWTNAKVAFGAIFFLPNHQAVIHLLKGFVTL